MRFLPAGVVLAVVDPGVGGERRALALRSEQDGRLFVGPDNGLLMAAVDRLGGVAEAVEIGDSPSAWHPTSNTFHGRDVFAPVAGALAAGEPLSAVGEPVPAEGIVRLQLPCAEPAAGGLLAHVIHRDTFGNLVLDARPEQLAGLGVGAGAGVRVECGGPPPRSVVAGQLRTGARGGAAAVRGLLGDARAGGQPRLRRRVARGHAGPGGSGGTAVSAAAGEHGRPRQRAPRGPHGTRVLGAPRLHLRLTDSTNSRARELALGGAPHGTIVTATEQSAGRGRQGRTWSAPAGSSLLLSVVLRDPPQLLPLTAAVAVAEVVGGQALIKWPNDVVVEQAQPGGAGAGEGGRDPRGGAPAGAMGGAGDRAERGRAARGPARRTAPRGHPPGGHDGAP